MPQSVVRSLIVILFSGFFEKKFFQGFCQSMFGDI